MAKKEFFLSVRTAIRIGASKVELVGVPDSPATTERRLANAALWLTPKAVEGYDPDDFRDASSDVQNELREAVQAFAEFAGAKSTQVVGASERERGADLFRRVVHAVRSVVLPEWQRGVETLLSSAEEWSRTAGWATRRSKKQLSELILGEYELPNLLIQSGGARLLLDPIARFVVGAEGMADFYVMPSFGAVMIPFEDGQWHIHIDRGNIQSSVERRSWSESAFHEAVEWLRRHG